MKTKTNESKKNHLTLQRRKHVNVELLSNVLGGKRISAKKVKYGVVLTSYDNGGFSTADAIKIAEALDSRYNGKCIV